MKDTKVAILGCGNIGQSIAKGLISNDEFSSKNLTVTKRNISSIKSFEDFGVKVTTDNIGVIKNAEIIIIAVKPYKVEQIINEIKPEIVNNHHIIISLATSISTLEIQEMIGYSIPVYRVMPNIAAEINESMTCICQKNSTSEIDKKVEWLFNKIGVSLFINEELMEASTILGACGIAYVLRFIRGMIQGGVQIGFDAETANTIVSQTVKGSAELLIKQGKHPEVEIDKVTTPKGCTIKGLNEMEHQGFSSSLIKGIVASYTEIEK